MPRRLRTSAYSLRPSLQSVRVAALSRFNAPRAAGACVQQYTEDCIQSRARLFEGIRWEWQLPPTVDVTDLKMTPATMQDGAVRYRLAGFRTVSTTASIRLSSKWYAISVFARARSSTCAARSRTVSSDHKICCRGVRVNSVVVKTTTLLFLKSLAVEVLQPKKAATLSISTRASSGIMSSGMVT